MFCNFNVFHPKNIVLTFQIEGLYGGRVHFSQLKPELILRQSTFLSYKKNYATPVKNTNYC